MTQGTIPFNLLSSLNSHCWINAAKFALSFAAACVAFGQPLVAQDESLQQAMKIAPKQGGIDFDQPGADELKGCKVNKSSKPPGFIVTDASGRLLRQFFDNNSDGKLDQWSYFQNGIEVYRDLDTDFNRKADQYRWLGSGGTRWGVDPDQDGTIDAWKVISAEEVAQEVFEAIKTKDSARFQKLLLTPDEFSELQLGKAAATRIKERWQAAKAGFSKAVSGPLEISKSATWVQWGNGRPSMCPAGFEGNRKDIICYDHGSGVYQSGKEFGQVAVGSMLLVGDVWRVVELPELVREGKPIENGGVLFPLPEFAAGDVPAPDLDTSELTKLYESLDEVEAKLQKAKRGAETAKLELEKARTMVSIYDSVDEPREKQDWLENIADSVSSSHLEEKFPSGLDFLASWSKELRAAGVKKGVDYIAWRSIFSKYSLAMSVGDNSDRTKAQAAMMDAVEDFVDRFPNSRFTPEGMHSLALNSELADRDSSRPLGWYKKLATNFPDSSYGKRAKGALVRLTSKGKTLPFSGVTSGGKKFSLANRALRGKLVVLHFYQDWADDGFDTLERLVAKHDDNVVFVGCNVDNSTDDFKAFMSKNRNVKWLQLHAPGGVESSPLAQQLGIATLPMVLMVDGQGKLVESNLAFGDLERAIQRELKRAKRTER